MARVIFLDGLGRSGTTLIEQVMGQLPGVCALGKVVHLWQRDLRDDERCGCGERLSACEFWERVDVHRVLALRDLVELGQSHSAAGNPMRFSTGRIDLRHDTAWTSQLAPRQRAVVSAMCGPMLRAYGYPIFSTTATVAATVAAEERS